MTASKRRPKAFRPDSHAIITEPAPSPPPPLPEEPEATPLPRASAPGETVARGIRWGALLGSAITGLVALGLGVWFHDLVSDLMARSTLIGWLATLFLILAGLAAGVLAGKEIWAFSRLSRLGTLRHDAEAAMADRDKEKAIRVVSDLDALYARRRDLAWARASLAEHRRDVMDATELLRLAERELMVQLDAEARTVVANAAKRISVITAIVPTALIDILFVAAINLRMLRRLAGIYGARPGALGVFKLARMVVTHLVLSGGIAMGDDMLQQLLGQKLSARLSARLGEGVFNGALTARIGIATIAVCRPLPHIETTALRFRDVASQIVSFGSGDKKT